MLGGKRRLQDTILQATTIIGADTRIVGQLYGDGVFIICGEIEGNSDIAGPVTIANAGHWVGKLQARDIVITETVEGDVHATDKLELTPSAHVIGNIAGGQVAIAQGARIEGSMVVTQSPDVTHFVERRT